MRIKQDIDLNLVKIDRLPLDKKTLKYALSIQKSGRRNFPPIKVAKTKNGRFEIRDGRHRWLAHKLAGETKILAKFSEDYLKQ